MSILEEKLNQDINELQKFVHNNRRQAIYSQSTMKRREQPLSYYCSLLETSNKSS